MGVGDAVPWCKVPTYSHFTRCKRSREFSDARGKYLAIKEFSMYSVKLHRSGHIPTFDVQAISTSASVQYVNAAGVRFLM